MFIYNQVSTVEFFHKKTIFVMMASIVAAGLNVVLNSIFIPIYDFYAAGYTTLACYIVYATLHYANMRHISQKHYGRNLFDSKFLISWSIFILLVTVGISFLYKFIVIRYMTVLVFVLILIWKRNYFLSMIKSIRK